MFPFIQHNKNATKEIHVLNINKALSWCFDTHIYANYLYIYTKLEQNCNIMRIIKNICYYKTMFKFYKLKYTLSIFIHFSKKITWKTLKANLKLPETTHMDYEYRKFIIHKWNTWKVLMFCLLYKRFIIYCYKILTALHILNIFSFHKQQSCLKMQPII